MHPKSKQQLSSRTILEYLSNHIKPAQGWDQKPFHQS